MTRFSSVVAVGLLVSACAAAPAATYRSSDAWLSTVAPASAAAPASPAAPAPSGEVVRGWPDTSENQAGLYSWDGDGGGLYSNEGFMHNGYGAANLEIRIDVVPDGPVSDDSATAVTVAGHHGIYRRIDAEREEWIVDIDGTTIAIRLEVRPGTSQTYLDEAHGIVESMRYEPQDNDMGFRLVFRLTTDDWDSG